MIKILTFKIEKSENFIDEIVDNNSAIKPINWKYKTYENFKNQVINNYVNLDLIKKSCLNRNNIIIFENSNVTDPKFDDFEIKKRYVYNENKCNKFLDIYESYMDVVNRDIEAFTQENFKSDIYAIVLLYNDKYYGHIYSWIYKNRCFGMGIRTRSDNLFSEEKIKNISYYLLQGVKNFSKMNKLDEFIIVSPLRIMVDILIKLDFKKIVLNRKSIGNNMGDIDDDFIYCYSKNTDVIDDSEILYF